MNDLTVLNKDGQLVVTSRQIADDFEKEHNDTKKRIRELIKDVGEISHNYFIQSEYTDSINRRQEEYLITRDGFSLLVMGFTGPKALSWKLKYIQAFNEMEQSLKNIQPKFSKLSKELQSILMLDAKTQNIENRIGSLEDSMPLFNVECKELQALVKKVGIKVLGGYKSKAYNDNSIRTKVYKDIQQQLKREFGIARYEGIKRCQLDVAKGLVNNYKTPLFLADEITLINDQISFGREVM